MICEVYDFYQRVVCFLFLAFYLKQPQPAYFKIFKMEHVNVYMTLKEFLSKVCGVNFINDLVTQEIPTPVKWDNLNKELEGYDKDLRTYLVNGFKYGFSIGCVETPTAPLSKNHNSALKK